MVVASSSVNKNRKIKSWKIYMLENDSVKPNKINN